MIQFCCFNPIPWPNVPRRPEKWPFPNRDFDPHTAEAYYKAQIEQLVHAEECGFDWIGIGEDHMTAWGLTPNPNLILSVLACRTKRVKLAILGAPLPLLNPVRVAEECAMIDVLSGGRLIVGFIRGVPQNYKAYGVEENESRSRFEEASRLVIRAWTSKEVFEWRGNYYHFSAISIWPRPIQVPHPPLIFSANSPESAIMGAKYKAKIGAIHLYNRNALKKVEACIGAYKFQAQFDGWQPSNDHFLIGLQTCIADSDQEAQDLLEPALDYQFKVLSGTYDKEKIAIEKEKPGYGHAPVEEAPPTLKERLAHHIVLCGSPRTVTDQIDFLCDALGVGVISMHFQVGNMKDQDVRKGMQLFRDKVMPHFRPRDDEATRKS